MNKKSDQTLLVVIIIMVILVICCCLCTFGIFWGAIEEQYKSDRSSKSNTTSSAKLTYSQCFNRVQENADIGPIWPDGCKGINCKAQTVAICTQAVIKLSTDELPEYHQWVSAGKPKLIGCECYDK